MIGATRQWPRGRVPQLDGIRAVAIGIVMISHTAIGRYVPGKFGVTLFFFLSGYLITSLLRLEANGTGRIDLIKFYLRRSVRILPPMVITILFTTALAYGGVLPDRPLPREIAADLAFLTNYAGLLGISGQEPSPLWSLDVEEHFYILFSLFFAGVLARRKPPQAALACAGLCLAVLLARIAHWHAGTDLESISFWSHTRLDSILFGCMLALWQNPLIDRGAWRPPGWAVAAALIVVLFTFVMRDEVFRQTLRYTLQGGALFVLFSAALHDRGAVTAILGSAPLRVLALLSYTLYLVHLPLLIAVGGSLGFLAVPVAFALAAGYAWAMYRWVELPLGRWRRRLERKHLQGDAGAIAANGASPAA